jgi:hypothetical protein
MASVAACDGDGGDTDVTIAPSGRDTPAAEASPTSPAAVSPTAGEAPEAPVPDVDPSLEVLNLGEVSLSVGPGATYGFEPLDLADEAPPCAAFAFLFGWQVQDPYPPDDVELTITSTRMEATETIGEGTSGTATVGCGFIEVNNGSAVAISMQIRYAVAQQTE